VGVTKRDEKKENPALGWKPYPTAANGLKLWPGNNNWIKASKKQEMEQAKAGGGGAGGLEGLPGWTRKTRSTHRLTDPGEAAKYLLGRRGIECRARRNTEETELCVSVKS